MGIKQKAEYLADTKEAIKDAIISKGVDVDDNDSFRDYAEKITAISVGGVMELKGYIYEKDGGLYYVDASGEEQEYTALAGQIQDVLSELQTIKDSAGKTPVVTLENTSGTIQLQDGAVNVVTISGSTTFELPTVGDNYFHQILVQLTLDRISTINLGTSLVFNSEAVDLSETGKYNLIYEYDNNSNQWAVGGIIKGVV